jgi:hypothetical protein
MNVHRKRILRISIGGVLIAIGLIIYWWSAQLVWILIYPPPFGQQLLETMPYVFWVIGVSLILYEVARAITAREGSR